MRNAVGVLTLVGVVVIAILGTLLVLAQRDQAAALADVTAVLNRRSPTLEYLNCHDKRQDKALDDAFALLLAGKDASPDSIERLTAALAVSLQNLLDASDATAAEPCPELPK